MSERAKALLEWADRLEDIHTKLFSGEYDETDVVDWLSEIESEIRQEAAVEEELSNARRNHRV